MFVQLILFGIFVCQSLVESYPSNDPRCLNYCSNENGICLIENDQPTCYCLPEWEGERCDSIRTISEKKPLMTRIQARNTPCTYVPDLCKNGGVCYLDDTSKKLACQCPYPYDGTRCDEYSVCYNYCYNSGICTVTGDGADKAPECDCAGTGYEGTRCQQQETTTAPPSTTTTTTTEGSTTTDVICSYLPDGYCNSGSCVVENDRARCQCPSTHTGDQCQNAVGGTVAPGQTNPPVNPGRTNPPVNPGQSSVAPSAGLRSPVFFNNDEDAFAEKTGLGRVEQDCEGHSRPRYQLLKEVKFFEVLVKSYRECDSAPFVFDLLIKSCLELKKIDGSIEIVKMLGSKGISPSISTCNALISEVSRCKGSFVGYGVFREVFGLESCEHGEKMRRGFRARPNVHSFNELMVGFYRNGEVEMVEEIWSEMGRFGCVANGFSYGVLMAVFCEVGRLSEAERLWEEMRVKGIMPDVVAYNTVIGGFCKAGDVEKAEGLYREMGLSGIESSCVTFEHLIEGYCRIGDVDSAILVYKDMHRRDFRLEAVTMELLIGGLCEQKRVFEALKIMRSAMRDVSFHPSGKSYELLINGLCEDGKIEEALKLQSEMVGKGFDPNSAIYDAFIEGHVKLGNEETAAMLRKEMSVAQKQKQED